MKCGKVFEMKASKIRGWILAFIKLDWGKNIAIVVSSATRAELLPRRRVNQVKTATTKGSTKSSGLAIAKTHSSFPEDNGT